MNDEYTEIISGNEEKYDAIQAYIEDSNLIVERVEGNMGKLYFLKKGRIFLKPGKRAVEICHLPKKTLRELEKIIAGEDK